MFRQGGILATGKRAVIPLPPPSLVMGFTYVRFLPSIALWKVRIRRSGVQHQDQRARVEAGWGLSHGFQIGVWPSENRAPKNQDKRVPAQVRRGSDHKQEHCNDEQMTHVCLVRHEFGRKRDSQFVSWSMAVWSPHLTKGRLVCGWLHVIFRAAAGNPDLSRGPWLSRASTEKCCSVCCRVDRLLFWADAGNAKLCRCPWLSRDTTCKMK